MSSIRWGSNNFVSERYISNDEWVISLIYVVVVSFWDYLKMSCVWKDCDRIVAMARLSIYKLVQHCISGLKFLSSFKIMRFSWKMWIWKESLVRRSFFW